MQLRAKWWIPLVLGMTVLMGFFLSRAWGVHYLPPVKYGEAFTLYFNVYDSNSPWKFYATAPAAADVHVYQDGASMENPTNSITDLGKTFSLQLAAAEMQAAVVVVEVNDISSPKLYMDDSWVIPTYGHSSALSAFDLDDAIPPVDIHAVDGNESGAAGLAQVYESDFSTDFNDAKKMWNTNAYYIRGATPGSYDDLMDANDFLENLLDTIVTDISDGLLALDPNGAYFMTHGEDVAADVNEATIATQILATTPSTSATENTVEWILAWIQKWTKRAR